MFYLKAAMDVACEMPADNWRALFRTPAVRRNLKRLFDGYRNKRSNKSEFDRNRLLAQEAMTELWCGHYEKSHYLMTHVPEDLDLSRGFHKYAPISWRGEPRKTIDAEIRGFTGPHKDSLLEAEATQLAGLTSQSLTLFEQTAARCGDDPPLRAYLAERVAYVRMATRNNLGFFNFPYPASALKWAVADKHNDIAQALMDAGVDVNWKDKMRYAAIDDAIGRNDRPLIEALLNHGARLDARPWDWSPLAHAVCNMPDLVPNLLKAPGADAHLPDWNGWTPLHYALRRNLRDLALLLLDYNPNLNLRNKEGWAPLHLALRYENPEAAKRLIEMGADVRLPCVEGLTSLHIAARENYPDIVAMIVQRGADLNATTQKGDTPLKAAVRDGRREVVSLLLKAGADLNARGPKSDTPLVEAIFAHQSDVALDLIARGADPNAVVRDDFRAIHVAAQEGPIEVVKALLERGADATAKCSEGTALDMARKYKHPEIARILENWKR